MPSAATAVTAPGRLAGGRKNASSKQHQKGHLAETRMALGHFRDMIKKKVSSSGKNKKGGDSRCAAAAAAVPTASTNQDKEPNGTKAEVATAAAAAAPAAAVPKVTFHFSEDGEKKEEVGASASVDSDEGGAAAAPAASQKPRRQRPNRTKQMSDDTMISMMCADDLVDDGWDEDELDDAVDAVNAGEQSCEQLEKIAALADMSFNTCLKSGDSRKSIVESGALRVCLFSMKSNPDKPAVLAEACRFLGNLMDDDDESHLSDPNLHTGECVSLTKTIVHRGGVEMVVDAMNAHPQHADLQDSGCFALSRLLDNLNSTRGTVARAGGFKAVVVAMRNHPTEKSIQIDGCTVLQLVVDNSSSSANNSRKIKRNDHYRRLVIQAGGLEAVAACLRHFPDDPDVFDDATSAMQALWPSRGPPESTSRKTANKNGVLVVEPM